MWASLDDLWKMSPLTAQFVPGTSNHVVEDVKSSLRLCLSDTARLLQKVWQCRVLKNTEAPEFQYSWNKISNYKIKASYEHFPDWEKPRKQDTSLYIGSNNVAGDVKVDPDKFTLWRKWGGKKI